MKTLLLLFITLTSCAVHAATVTWTNGSTDGLWNTPGNWSGGSVPLPGDDVVFNATSVANCTVDAPGASFDGLTITAAYTGIIDLNGQSFVSNGVNNSTLSGGTINDTPGTSSVSITTSGIYTGNGTTFGADVVLNVGRMEMDGSVYNGSFTGTQTGASTSTGSGNNTFGGVCNINNTGDGEIRMGSTGPDIFNGVTTINNTGTSYIRLAFGSVGTQFNGNLVVNSNNSLGVRFGTGVGTATLSAGSTITTTGYNSGDLYMENFIQAGATAQTLSLTGTGRILMYSSTWNGSVDFDAPRIYLSGNTFNAVTDLEKTGAGGDNSIGNNTFAANTTLRNSGSAAFSMGNGNPDDFQADLTLLNSGTDNIVIAASAAGHTIGGNLSATNSGSAVNINLSSGNTATLVISGDVNMNNTSAAANSNLIIGNSGDVSIGGNLTFTSTSTGTNSYLYLANNTDSEVAVTGTTNITNNATGATTHRAYIGNNGDVTFGGDLTLTNNSTSTNSEMHVHRATNSQVDFNGNIEVSAPNGANCEGIRFGENGGSGTLAATRTVTVGAAGFNANILRFSNFTQTGATAQSLSLTGTARLYISDASWGGNVDFDAPRMYTSGTLYSGTVNLEKTGATGDSSPGGNTFTGATTLTNSGSGNFTLGNGTADVFLSGLTVNNSGSASLSMAYDGAGHSVTGNIDVTLSGSANGFNMANQATSSLAISGNLTLNNTSAGNNNVYIGNQGDITVGGTLDLTNNSTAASSNHYIANGANSSVSITGVSTLTNSGSGATTQRIYAPSAGIVTYGDNLIATNNATATNSEMHFANAATSSANYNGNIIVASASGTNCDGIRFGESGGTGVLAATRTISVGGAGYDARILRISNFTQTGATAQAITTTGTSRIYITNSDWGGNVDFAGPRFYTENTLYQGTADLEKTGVSDDYSAGNNTFNTDVTLTNTGSGIFGMGNGALDVFSADLTVLNSGSSQIRLSNSNSLSTVSGNFVGTNSGNGTGLVIAGTGSGLDVSGNATITNTTTANNNIHLGNAGSFVVGGDLSFTQTPSAATSNAYLGNATTSSVTVAGTTTIVNGSTGATTSDIYVGNNGDVTFNGVLNLSQTSASTNSRIFCNHTANSSGAYNQNIVVESTNASGDGIYFGQGGGSGTLAAGRTVTVGAGGFLAGYLMFRNFTQLGPTAQSLTLTGSAYAYNYDSDWGGDFTFIAPRHHTRGTTYNGTAYLEKTGADNDHSEGGNLYVGNAALVHSGANNFLHGNNNPDVFQSDVDIINSGTGNFYLAHNSAGNTVAGNLSYDQQGTAVNGYIGNGAASTLAIMGNVTMANSATVNTNMVLSNSGSVTIGGDLDFSSTNSGASSNSYMASAATASLEVNGNTTISNNGTGATTQRFWIGNAGDVTFNGTVDFINSTGATNSEMYVAYATTSTVDLNQDITLQSTDANCDGIRFGANGGISTLAATRTVTVGAGGFISGDLLFRNFTQVGPTAQSLTCTGTARGYNYDSDWGGDFTFIAPRMLTRGTQYNGTAYLEKSGGISNDQSAGGNTFVGNTELRNSGSTYFMMGNGTADVFQNDLLINNIGSDHFYLANNSAGNTIAGALTINNGGSANTTYISNGAASSVSVTGITTANNSSNGANSNIILGVAGDMTIGGNVTMTNTASNGNTYLQMANGTNSEVTLQSDLIVNNLGTGTNNRVYIANSGILNAQGAITITNSGTNDNAIVYMASNTSSSVTVANETDITNNGTATTTQFYLGSNGDMTFNGLLDIHNSSTSANSQVYCNNGANSQNTYNSNIIVESSAAGCDGVFFGNGNGSGTLAAGQTVTVGGAGFSSGQLLFRNFTQTGGTAQNITVTNTGTIFYNYDSEWNGDVDFRGPRHYTRGTTYNGTAHLEKTDATNDASAGGNTFNGDTEIENSGTGYFMPANGTGNDVNADISFIQSSTGLIYPCYNSVSTYAGDINIDYTNNQIYFGAAGNGRATFDGTGAQAINDLNASTTPNFRDFHVDKSGGELTLNMPLNVTVELDLDQGVVNTSTANLMTMNNNATVSSVSDGSHIDGPIEKIGNDAFTFPVGNLDVYQPISMSNPASNAASFRAQYFNTDPAPSYDDTQLDATIHHISDCEYWTLDRTNGTNNVSVTLGFKPHTGACSGVTDPSTLVVARWDGSVWRDHGNGGTTGTPTSGDITTSGAVTNFSPFTLASTVNFPVNPLPVELLSFTADKNDGHVDLKWTTASEINNDYFTLEKSLDGQTFEYFAVVEGAGNSSIVIDYLQIDENPVDGWNYYKLYQTDYDGTINYQGEVSVHFDGTMADVVIFPNPSNHGNFTILTSYTDNGKVEIFDAGGRLVKELNYSGKRLDIEDFGLPAGVYSVSIKFSGQQVTKKLIVR